MKIILIAALCICLVSDQVLSQDIEALRKQYEEDVIDLITPSITAVINKKDKTPAEKTEAKLGKLLLNEPNIPAKSLNNIKAETLVMAGDNDVIRPEHTLLIHQNIPRSYLWIAPNSGHSGALVYKDDFNKNEYRFFKNKFGKIESAARFF
jgi:pimeloyl-ACP methyl ester carboxylesterase